MNPIKKFTELVGFSVFFCWFIAISAGWVSAQVGIGTAAPMTHSQLDIRSSDKGLLVPRLTTGARTALGSALISANDPLNAGMQVYDTDLQKLYIWNESTDTWDEVATGSAVGPWTESGINIYPTTLSNRVGIGTATPAQLLDVNGASIFRGQLDMNTTNRIVNLQDPVNPQDAATKNYVDAATSPGNFIQNQNAVDQTASFRISGTGQIAGNAEINGGQLGMFNPTSNWIRFIGNTAVPSFTTRSAGTRLILNPNLSGLSTDYAIGVAPNEQWYSVTQNATAFAHRFYGGTTPLMTIRGDGNVGIGTTSPSTRLYVEGPATAPAPYAIIGGGGSVTSQTNLRLQDNGTAANSEIVQEFAFSDVGPVVGARIRAVSPSANMATGSNLRLETYFNNSGGLNANQLTLFRNGTVGIAGGEDLGKAIVGTLAPPGGEGTVSNDVPLINASSLIVSSPTHNGGATPAPAEPVLTLWRSGVASSGWMNIAQFKLSKYASGAAAQTRLHIGMTNGINDPNASDVMVLQGNGNVGIGQVAPTQKLELRDGNLLLSNTGTAGQLRFQEPNASGANFTAFRAQAQAADITYTLPAASANGVLTNDGSGTLSWATPVGDNLGNHTATSNIDLGGFTLVGGGAFGIQINSSGHVGIGTSPSTTRALRVFTASIGGVDADNSASGTNIFAVKGVASNATNNGFGVIGQTNSTVAFSAGIRGVSGGGSSYAGQFVGRVGIGSSNEFEVSPTGDLVRVNNVPYSWPAAQGGAGTVLTNNGSGSLSWTTLPIGENTTASNGLSLVGPDVRLGGTLTAATTITQGANALTVTNNGTANTVFNLTSTGDFDIQDNGVSALFVSDAANVGIGTNLPGQRLQVNNGNFLLSNTGTAGQLRFQEPNASGANFTAFQAQAQAADITYTLPAASATGVLTNDGTGGLSWSNSAGTVTVPLPEPGATNRWYNLGTWNGANGARFEMHFVGSNYFSGSGINNSQYTGGAYLNYAMQDNIGAPNIQGFYYTYGGNPIILNSKAVRNGSNQIWDIYIDLGPFIGGGFFTYKFSPAGNFTLNPTYTTPVTDPGAPSTTIFQAFNRFAITSGNVGIGQVAPTQKLELRDGNLLVSNSGTAGQLRFQEPNASGANFTAFQAQAQAADVTYTLPAAAPAINGQALTSTTGGAMSWTTLPIGENTTASNGLTLLGPDVRLGGTLITATTITQGANALTITNNGTANTVFNLTSTGDFDIQDNGVSALFVSDAANVGIGTNLPGQRLQVNNGNFLLSNTGTAGQLRFQEPNASGANFTAFQAQAQAADVTYTLPAAQGAANTFLRNDGTGTLSWVTGIGDNLGNHQQTMALTTSTITSGNVIQIGDDVHIQDVNVNNSIGIFGIPSGGTEGGIRLGGIAATNNPHLLGTATAFNMSFNGTNRFTVLNGGNVGIGTAAPAQRLEIQDGNILLSNTGTAGQMIFREPSAAGTNFSAFQAQAQAANVTYTLPAAAPAINGQALTSTTGGAMSWTTLPIGENTTASNGLSLVGPDVRLGGTLTAATTITQGANALTVTNNGTANTVFNLTSTGDFDIQDNGVSALFVSDAANVGIGTITPTNRLVVSQDIISLDYDSFGQIAIRGATNPDKVMMMGFNTNLNFGYIMASIDNVAPQNLILNPLGANVGITTTTPSEKLEVSNGNIFISNNTNNAGELRFQEPSGSGTNFTRIEAQPQAADILYTLPAAQGAANTFLRNDGSGGLSWANAATSANNGLTLTGSNVQLGGPLTAATTITQGANALTVTNNGTANTVFNLTSTGDFDIQDNGATAFFVRDDGFIGIGTTFPSERLEVQGNIIQAGGFKAGFLGSVGIGHNFPAQRLDVSNGNILLSNTGTAGQLRFQEPNASGLNFTAFQAQAQTADIAYTLPAAQGAAGTVLTNNGAGVLSWTATGTGDITAVGSMLSGDAFAGPAADDQWLGLGAAAGRIEFDDQATDEVLIRDANLGIGTTTPTHQLEVVGSTGALNAVKIQNNTLLGGALWADYNGTAGNAIYATAVGFEDCVWARHNGAGRAFRAESANLAQTTSINTAIVANFATTTTGSLTKRGLEIVSIGSWVGAGNQNIGLDISVSGGTTNYAALLNGGNVGIGTSTPLQALDVNGNAIVRNSLSVGTTLLGTSGIQFGGENTYKIIMQRKQVSGIGQVLDIEAGGSVAGATNNAGGTLQLSGGQGTGSSNGSRIEFLTYNPGASGNTDQTRTVKMTLTANGNVGIGTGTPQGPLHITSNTMPSANLQNGAHLGVDVANVAGLQLVTNGNTPYIDFLNDNVNDQDARIILTGDNCLEVQGANLNATLTCVSDARYKTDVENLPSVLSTLDALRPVTYHWKDDSLTRGFYTDRLQHGFIAQELEAVIPELVHTKEDGYKSVDYVKLTPFLTKAVQELHAENRSLRQALETQATLIEQLRAELRTEVQTSAQHLSALEARLARLEQAAKADSTTTAEHTKR